MYIELISFIQYICAVISKKLDPNLCKNEKNIFIFQCDFKNIFFKKRR